MRLAHTPTAATVVIAACGMLAAVFLIRRKRALKAALSAPDGTACKRGMCAVPKAPASGGGSGCVMLVPQTFSKAFQLEYSIHRLSRLLRTDVELVFRPDLEDAYQSDPRGAKAGVSKEAFLQEHLLAVPTWQPSSQDLSEISDVVNQERRALLKNFDAWAAAVRPRLSRWSDCSCPMEGNARFGTSTSTIYNELEGLTQLLRYDAIPIGCCGIVLHPKWHRRAYPVTFFTTAPLDELVRVLGEVEVVNGDSRGSTAP